MAGVDTLKSVLPNVIQDEIFRLSSRVNDVAIDYLCADLEQCGYSVRNVHNFDCSVIIDLECLVATVELADGIQANVRIDRISRSFEVVAKKANYTILPRQTDWNGVLEYLTQLHDLDINDC